MPAPGAQSGSEGEPDPRREAAQSFGADAERYDRARPRYPAALIERIAADAGGGAVLDVGAGTGILSRQLQAAGCLVLAVDPDARLADFARRSGVEIEVSTFEGWDARGRRFDAVVSGESWHWIDPVAGAARAGEVLRPGGHLVVCWNTGRPPTALEDAFTQVYRRVLPPSLAARVERSEIERTHAALRARAADGMRSTGAFTEPEEWRFEWTQSYTRDQWLDALQTSGGAVPEDRMGDLLAGVGPAIESAGGSFTMEYVTFALSAARGSAARSGDATGGADAVR